MFNSTNIVALIGIVLTVIAMMSMRLATIMSHEHPILEEGTKEKIDAATGKTHNSSLSGYDGGGHSSVNQSGNNNLAPSTPNEYSKLLV